MKNSLLLLLITSSLFSQEIIDFGNVLVDGKKITKSTTIQVGDTITTGKKSSVRFNIGKDAFKAKENSTFKLEKIGKKRVLNVINGGVLAVFGKGGKHAVKSPNMTAGIRGTGVYVFADTNRTYFCTCYGHTHVDAAHQSREYKATHHNMIWISDNKITPSKEMLGHTDDELRTLEGMVGRTCPFDEKK